MRKSGNSKKRKDIKRKPEDLSTMVVSTLRAAIFTALAVMIVAIVFKKWEAAIGAGVAALLLGGWGTVFIYILQRESDRFVADLCKLLDDVIYGEKKLELSLYDTNLLDRVRHRVERLNNIMQEKNSKLEDEKRELQTIVSDISHQTKTPIANLKIINDTLIARDIPKEKTKDFLKASVSQLDKLEFLIQVLVEMSQLETGVIILEKKSVPMVETLACAINEIQLKMEKKHINLKINCKDDFFVLHDKKWTSEVFLNLLDNAVKYTNSYGTIDVNMYERELYMEIAITDTGRGIPEEEQGAIFKRFYREKAVHDIEGIGIGLYLARQIITMQGGYIRVVSEVNKGATFSVFFPKK